MSKAHTRRPGELAFAVVLAAFSLFAAYQAWLIAGFSSVSSPGMFPMIAAGAMVVSGMIILAEAIRKKPEAERNTAQRFFADITPIRLLVFAALIVAYMLALEPLGFALSSFAFLFISISYLRRGNVLLNLLLSGASLAIIYIVFRYVFAVVLPAGRLF